MTHKSSPVKSWIVRFWKSRLFYVAGLVLLVFIGSNLTKEIIRRFEVEREIRQLEYEISALEERNESLLGSIAALRTTTSVEKEARMKLSLQKPEETVVALSRPLTHSAVQEVISITPDVRSNPEKWLDRIINP